MTEQEAKTKWCPVSQIACNLLKGFESNKSVVLRNARGGEKKVIFRPMDIVE